MVIGKPSDHSLDCPEDSMLAVGNPDLEKTILERFPHFETLCRILSEELAAKNQASFYHFTTSSPEQRYLDLIRHRPDLVQWVPQYQLESYLGTAPQSLCRIRRRLLCRV